MAAHRFFLTRALEPGLPAPLSAPDLHHAVDALRLKPGEDVVLVEPDGTAWRCIVVTAEPTGLLVDAEERVARVWEPDVTLVMGVAKGGKVDDAIEGAVEVGVGAVWPLLAARSVVKLDPKKRTERAERWRRVAYAAAKQAQRAVVPSVDEPADLRDLLPALAAFDLVLVAWEDAAGTTIHHAIEAAVPGPEARVAVVVGPEGGLSADEVASMTAIGAVAVTLGPTILRAETAGVVAPALAIAEMRELHAPDDAR